LGQTILERGLSAINSFLIWN